MCKIYCRTKADIGPVVVMMMMVMIMVMAVVRRVMMMLLVVMVTMTKQLTDATVEPRLKSPGDKLQLEEPAQQQPPTMGMMSINCFFKLSMFSSANPCHKVCF